MQLIFHYKHIKLGQHILRQWQKFLCCWYICKSTTMINVQSLSLIEDVLAKSHMSISQLLWSCQNYFFALGTLLKLHKLKVLIANCQASRLLCTTWRLLLRTPEIAYLKADTEDSHGFLAWEKMLPTSPWQSAFRASVGWMFTTPTKGEGKSENVNYYYRNQNYYFTLN